MRSKNPLVTITTKYAVFMAYFVDKCNYISISYDFMNDTCSIVPCVDGRFVMSHEQKFKGVSPKKALLEFSNTTSFKLPDIAMYISA